MNPGLVVSLNVYYLQDPLMRRALERNQGRGRTGAKVCVIGALLSIYIYKHHEVLWLFSTCAQISPVHTALFQLSKSSLSALSKLSLRPPSAFSVNIISQTEPKIHISSCSVGESELPDVHRCDWPGELLRPGDGHRHPGDGAPELPETEVGGVQRQRNITTLDFQNQDFNSDHSQKLDYSWGTIRWRHVNSYK